MNQRRLRENVAVASICIFPMGERDPFNAHTV
jgi:hypothetical protein